MRVLAGPIDRSVQTEVMRINPKCEHEFVTFGKDGADIKWHGGRNSYAELKTQFPAGWTPDLILFNSPEYEAVPAGIEEAECTTAAIVGDWNLGGQAIHLSASMFDVLVADKNGCSLLQKYGFENVVYAPFFSYDPQKQHLMPDVERDLDIVMIGNFHADIQKGRAPWIARVAGLSRKHKVVLTSNVYGEEYTRAMNRAKIVFNRSIRGEINMRVYEAMACGAVMFYERENEEIESLFEDRKECVLYGDDDLEELLAYYLENDEERQKIADAGSLRVQSHTRIHKLLDVVGRVEQWMSAPSTVPDVSSRKFNSLSKVEQSYRRAYQWNLVPDTRALSKADAELMTLSAETAERADLMNLHGCTLAVWATVQKDPLERSRLWQQSKGQLARCVARDPQYVAARLNLAWTHFVDGEIDRARVEWKASELLLGEFGATGSQLMGPYLPRTFSASDVDIEWKWAHHTVDSPEWSDEMRRILLWRTFESLGRIAFDSLDFETAVRYASQGAALAGNSGQAHYHHARALAALGRIEEAVEAYRLSIQAAPLMIGLRMEFARFLSDAGRTEEALIVVDDTIRIIDGAPCFEGYRSEMEAIRRSCFALSIDSVEHDALRLLSFPNWNEPHEWQSLIRRYAESFKGNARVSLRLRVEPGLHPAVDELVPDLLHFIEFDLGIAQEDLPDITLLSEPMHPTSRWKLFLQADLLVSGVDSADNKYAEVRGMSIIAPSDLDSTLVSGFKSALQKIS
jgi:tetratricopeptide (TPR) repeat protein